MKCTFWHVILLYCGKNYKKGCSKNSNGSFVFSKYFLCETKSANSHFTSEKTREDKKYDKEKLQSFFTSLLIHKLNESIFSSCDEMVMAFPLNIFYNVLYSSSFLLSHFYHVDNGRCRFPFMCILGATAATCYWDFKKHYLNRFNRLSNTSQRFFL